MVSKSDISALTEKLAVTSVDHEAEGDSSCDISELSFAGKGLKLDTEKDAEDVAAAIRNFANLRCLCLEGNTLGVGAAKAIAKSLESHPELQLAYWKDLFTGRLKTEIPEALNYLSSGMILANAKLVELDLSDNAFGPIGMEGLAVLLRSCVCYSLLELKLNNNGLGITGGKMLAKCLRECLTESREAGRTMRLKVFVSGRNRLENEGATVLSEFFKEVKTMERVEMPQNGIRHVGVSALSQAFASNPHLTVINLNDNILTPKGATALASSLPQIQKLKVLNLGDCLTKTAGAKKLAAALKKGHDHLEELHLGFNEIASDGALEVAEAMRGKTKLRLLQLDGNQFGEDGCERLREAIRELGHPGALQSLSDDEGEPDEDEEEVEEEEDEEEEKDDSEGEDESAKEESCQRTEPCSLEEFLSVPTSAHLLGLGDSRADLLLQEAKKNNDEVSSVVRHHMEMLVKVCQAMRNDTVDIACACVDALFTSMFTLAAEADSHNVVTNTVLVYLGLIKSEDKTFEVTWDTKHLVTALTHAVKQSYFSKAAKETLEVFLSTRPSTSLDELEKHRLMQALFQF